MKLRRPWLWKLLAWLLLLTVAIVTLMPRPPRLDLPLLSWDKAQHFLAYAILAWSFLQAWEGSHAVFWILFLVVVGVLLEVLQGLMGVRSMEVFDMLANSLGVLLGFLLWKTPAGRGFLFLEARLSRL
jgi:VanZ family protein